MEENKNSVDYLVREKIDRYDYDFEKNLKTTGELTVTITLHEYRQLVSDVATAKQRISDAEKDKWAKENLIKSQQAEIDNLNLTIANMVKSKEVNVDE